MKQINSISDATKITKADLLEMIKCLSENDKIILKNKIIQMNKNNNINFQTIKIWVIRRLYPNLIKKSESLYNSIMEILE
jgi:hypothetical protein